MVKNLPTKAGGIGSVPGLGRCPGGRNDKLLQYSCLENSMYIGDWQATVHGAAETQLSDWAHFSSVIQLCLTICDSMDCSTIGSPVHHQLPKLVQTHVHWVSDAIQPSHPLSSPSIFPSIRVFSKESVLHIRWAKYWSFSFNISPSNEQSGLISFRIDWLDLLAVQGTLKSLFQHYSSKASILRHSAFFIVQHSHPYMTTEKTIALTKLTFFGKVMSLLFKMLSRLAVTFHPRNKCLLISWPQSMLTVILEPKKRKSVTVSPFICHEVMGPDAMISVFWMLSFKPIFFTLLFHFHQEAL